MKQIIVTRLDGTQYPLVERYKATAMTKAEQTWSLLSDDVIKITVETPYPQDYNIGDYITVFGRVYKLNLLSEPTKKGGHTFSYDLEFEGAQYDLIRVCYELSIDTTNNELQDVQAESLTGDLNRFMTVLISNLNRVFPDTWKLGTCPETDADVTLTFGESDNCLTALQTFCDEFEVEFVITLSNGVFTIDLAEETGQTFPYTFQFGRGRGLYELKRGNVDSSNIVTRLKVYGSTDNITSKYRAYRLCLPDKTKAQSYIEQEEALEKYGIHEATKYFDDIKPTFNGEVESVFSDSVLKFVDTSMFDLNELEDDGETTKYIMSSCNPKIHFNTGNLAGYEFEVSSYDHDTHTFTLIQQTDDRDDVFPSDASLAFQFGVGDTYKIIDAALPDDLTEDAESELLEEGTTYYEQNYQPKVQYELEVTSSYLENFVGDGTTVNIFAPGDYVPIKDTDIGVDKSVRITSLTRDLLDEYEYSLTLSDSITTSITNRVISELTEIDKIININQLDNPARARANWQTSRELLNMVFDPDGDYYTDKIKPLSIDTTLLSVGSSSMQYTLTNTIFEPNYNSNKNSIRVQGGTLTHIAISDSNLIWTLADNTTTFDSDSQAYYIYAKCERNGSAGSIIFSTEQILVESDATYYHFLVGTVSSVDADLDVRTLSLVYGYSLISGRYITTGRIQSGDGLTYFDLDDSEIAGYIKFINSDGVATSVADGFDNVNQALTDEEEARNTALATINSSIANLQSQVDGEISNWFYAYAPTLSNYPTSDWDDDEKARHVGDTFTNTASAEDGDDTAGQSWRFVVNSGVYSWSKIADSDAVLALQNAALAQSTADGKSTTYLVKPTSYSLGDMWILEAAYTLNSVSYAQGEMLTANANSDSFVSSHWSKHVTYTDDTTANTAITLVNTAKDAIAQQLGYTDYDTFVASAKASTTIIEGGYINTALIEVATLLAGQILTNAINVNDVFTVDSSGNMVAKSATITGSMKGVLTLDAGYSGSLTGVNILYLPTSSTTTTYGLPRGSEYLGRSIQVYNGSGVNQKLTTYGFNASATGSGYDSTVGESAIYNIPPKTSLVFTCFSCPAWSSGGYSTGVGGQWVIANRYNSNAKGYPMHVLAMGQAYGTSSGAWISNQETYDDNSLSIRRNSTGNYTVSMPSTWFSSSTDVQVVVVGMGWHDNGSSGNPIKATLVSTTSSSFTVALSDDASENEGKFQFIVIDNSEFSLNT